MEHVRKSIQICSTQNDSPIVCFVSKLIAVEYRKLSLETKQKIEDFDSRVRAKQSFEVADGDIPRTEVFFAVCRVFSGIIKGESSVSVLGPKFIPDGKHESHRFATATPVLAFRLMGPDLLPLEEVPAGNVVALYGLDKFIIKTATLTDADVCCSLSQPASNVAPLLRVAIQPHKPEDWKDLVSVIFSFSLFPTIDIRVVRV